MDTIQEKSLDQLTKLIQSQECADLVVAWQTKLTSLKAIAPEEGGDGEMLKAAWIKEELARFNLSTVDFYAKDSRVSAGVRPNLIAQIKGDLPKTLWIFGHMDVVGVGDLAAWKHDPFIVQKNGDWLSGRGVEDNQQAIVSMLILAWAMDKCQIRPHLSLGLTFMADEENGSRFGLEYILDQASDYFKKDDIYLVPDFGSPDGSKIQIAEKSVLWIKVEVIGQQCHASTPAKGKNAFLAAAKLITHLDQNLATLFPQKNDLFDPNISTITVTKHLANVSGVNIVPGREVFYLDCRILPEVTSTDAFTLITNLLDAYANKLGVSLKCEIVHHHKASFVDAENPTIPSLKKAIKKIYNVEPKLIGVGGGTVAAQLRERGLPAFVWSCIENSCHQPNEHSSIRATIKDSLVFANLLFDI